MLSHHSCQAEGIILAYRLIVNRKPRVLLIIPPVMQFNAAYPSVPVLAAFLREQGYNAAQADAGLELILHLFSRTGLTEIREELVGRRGKRHPSVSNFIRKFEGYAGTIDTAMRFLQNRAPEMAETISTRKFLPEGPRFDILAAQPPVQWRFNELDAGDRAKFLASLFIDDLADVIREGVDERFELSRYAEKLALSIPDFTRMKDALEREPTLVDRFIESIAATLVEKHHPDLIGFTIPFPGNLYGALRMARSMRKINPDVKIVIGGGYCNTELRSLKDPRIFDYIDYITLDDGEVPLLRIAESLKSGSEEKLVRTFVDDGGKVVFHDTVDQAAPPSCTPVFDGMRIQERVGIMELPNPMYRLWSDGGWNKLMLAHGCYWHKCAFCDTKLDYIRRYRPEQAKVIVDRLEAVSRDTGNNGFHFVDEAAPPSLLRGISREIINRKLKIRWWCNIRFEKTFTRSLVKLMAEAGCIAVTGGMETVCDRTLSMMEKGITVEQGVRVAAMFSRNGIMVHAYLMYGFPSQSVAETVDALEIVRQMFMLGIIQSAYWHRFALTVHSPMAASPEKYGIRLYPCQNESFAQNEIMYQDLSDEDPGLMAAGLRKSLYNYMYGVGLEDDVRTWFESNVPRPRVRRRFVAGIVQDEQAGHA